MEAKGIINIGIEHIYPHPDNPRKDLGDLTELAESIKKNGVMQNLTVIPGRSISDEEWSADGYTLIIGHRRHGAAQLAGIAEMPCRIIEGMNKKEQVSTMLEENMQRSDLTIYEQAQGFQMMLDLGETEQTIAEKTGFSKTTVRHRLNIAKLDQKTLQKKQQDDSFQLTLKDLLVLEQVEDMKTRNKILKEASSSRDIASKALFAVAESKRAKRNKQVVGILKKLGVEAAPENAKNEQYGGKWITVKDINLDEDVPEKINLKEKDQLYYMTYYRSVRIIKRVKKEKKSLTPEEARRKQRDRNIKQIKTEMKEMSVVRREFILNIISGKIAPMKNEHEVQEKIWRMLVNIHTGLYPSSMRSFLTGQEDYKSSDEERDQVQQQILGLSFTNSMLVVLHYSVERNSEICDWQGYFKPEVGKKITEAYEILKPYGFSLANEDKLLLNGTHELYVKPKK